MVVQSVQSFVRHADQFLIPYGLEMLGNGTVVGPAGTDVSQEFTDEFREHLASWDDQNLVKLWAGIDSSRVALTVNWVEGTAVLARDYDGEMVTIAEVEFEATEEPESTYEALNDAFEAAGLVITWNEDTADDEAGDVSTVQASGLGALR